VSDHSDIEILDVVDETTFGLLPPCVDSRFDHRSCDYWEDEVRGSKSARPSWWQEAPASPTRKQRRPDASNPFAPPPKDEEEYNPFTPAAMAAALDPLAGDDLFATPAHNPFAPMPDDGDAAATTDGPRKLRLLGRGKGVFGSYAKVLLLDSEPAVYAQFGPLSAYPRAQQIRELYARLPQSPLPAVITCIATTPTARARGLARQLVGVICTDLAARGFSALEAYPDLTLKANEASAADPDFWRSCGFTVAADDERYPVMRRDLG
jgi:hypothetical protein